VASAIRSTVVGTESDERSASMAVVVRMQWSGISREQYDAVRDRANWVADRPRGGIAHIASFDRAGVLRCTDVWASYKDFDRFLEDRLFPAVLEEGITTEPTIQFDDCYEAAMATDAAVTIPAQPGRRAHATIGS
jgi:hypothetical protein